MFVLGSGSDYCAVHKLYVRGHEIATYGVNRTGNTEEWTEFDWEKQFIDHAEEMVEKAFLPDDHVRGARTPLQKPGGDNQFNTLYNKVSVRVVGCLGKQRRCTTSGVICWGLTTITLPEAVLTNMQNNLFQLYLVTVFSQQGWNI